MAHGNLLSRFDLLFGALGHRTVRTYWLFDGCNQCRGLTGQEQLSIQLREWVVLVGGASRQAYRLRWVDEHCPLTVYDNKQIVIFWPLFRLINLEFPLSIRYKIQDISGSKLTMSNQNYHFTGQNYHCPGQNYNYMAKIAIFNVITLTLNQNFTQLAWVFTLPYFTGLMHPTLILHKNFMFRLVPVTTLTFGTEVNA